MNPIVDDGLTYSIANLATLATALTADVLTSDFGPQNLTFDSNPNTYTMWANMVAGSPAACSSRVDPKTIRAVLALALQSGEGIVAAAAIELAEFLCGTQLNRHMDFLAAQIVSAVVVARGSDLVAAQNFGNAAPHVFATGDWRHRWFRHCHLNLCRSHRTARACALARRSDRWPTAARTSRLGSLACGAP
jgi:hypothetical protein